MPLLLDLLSKFTMLVQQVGPPYLPVENIHRISFSNLAQNGQISGIKY